MTSNVVVVISDVFRLEPDGVARLAAAGFTVVARSDLAGRATPPEIVEALEGAWAVVAGGEAYPGDALSALPLLRVIARAGVGYDAIDVDAATRNGTTIVTTPGANDESVADHAVALILAVCRRLIQNDAVTRAGGWRSAPLGRDLAAASVGIVGLGAIGRGVATRLSGFGCRIWASEPKPDLEFCKRLAIRLAPLPELMAHADFLTIHVPLGPGTIGLIGRELLESLPRGAIVINTSRGRILDEEALIEGLANGQLGGAGLDVFADEPIRQQHPLIAVPNTVLTPHVAALTKESSRRMVDATIANLVAMRDGRRPSNAVNQAFVDGSSGRIAPRSTDVSGGHG
jgi:phosphoglycerate dehydrogenase-like enzyme